MTPELQPIALPPAQDALSWLDERADAGLRIARAIADEVRQGCSSADHAVDRWNDLDIAMSEVLSAASLFSEVHPDVDVRARAEIALQDAQALQIELAQDPTLYAVFSGLDATGLSPLKRRALDHLLRDFRRAGVALPPPQRARLKEIVDRHVVLGQEISKNTRDDVRSIKVSPERLAGMPSDWVEAHPAGPDGLVTITTDYPDAIPFRTFARDRAAREELAVEFLSCGWPANDALLQELFALRAEQAALLGFDTWADYDAQVKMIGSGPRIWEFVTSISDAARARAAADKQVLLDRLRQDVPDATDITTADVMYYAEAIRRENYAVDAQEVRQYFDAAAVREGLLAVTGRLFGLSWHPVPDAVTWHEDVMAYDVRIDGHADASEPANSGDSERQGELLGRIYLDLFPREGKYKHAAQFTLAPGVAGRQLAEGALICNFSRGLMEHGEVVTLFHEFGHLVHHIVAGRQPLARFSGVATEWDFVEAPSQMLEEWAWDPAVLATFAKNRDGRSIPADLVERMRRGNDFGKGYQARTQMFYAAVSYDFHVAKHDDLTARLRELQSLFSDFPYLPHTHMHCGFGHLDGYSSGYYTYMWSLVIAKDLFSAFDPNDLFAPQVARAYRDKVLAPGGSADAADLVSDFLGRPYTFDAYARWLAQ